MNRDADLIFSTLMEYERVCLTTAPGGDLAKAQSLFYGNIVTKFTTEAFSHLTCYLQTLPDSKNVLNVLMRSQKFAEAGMVLAKRALKESDVREKQGILGVSDHICTNDM
jgi:hypothetical protein